MNSKDKKALQNAKIVIRPVTEVHMDDEVQTHKFSEGAQGTQLAQQHFSSLSRTNLKNRDDRDERDNNFALTMTNIAASPGASTDQEQFDKLKDGLPKTSPETAMAMLSPDATFSKLQMQQPQQLLPINVIDYNRDRNRKNGLNLSAQLISTVPQTAINEYYSDEHDDLTTGQKAVEQQQYLTVTDGGSLKILPDIRQQITTQQEKKNAPLKAGAPSLRYVVKEELNHKYNYSRNSNEDLVNLCTPLDQRSNTDEKEEQQRADGEFTVIHQTNTSLEPAQKQQKSQVQQKSHNKKSPATGKVQSYQTRNLEEHLLSPFETDLHERDASTIGPIDRFSISGEFQHHMHLENNQQQYELQKITHLDSISKKLDLSSKPQWPADLQRAQEIAMTDRTPLKPPKIVGLPDIDVCQGREPDPGMLNLRISPQTSREMEHFQMQEEKRYAIELAQKLASPRFRKKKRSVSNKYRRKQQRQLEMEAKEREAAKQRERQSSLYDKDTSFIRTVLGRYIYDYDEYKRRQRESLKAQSIDIHDLNRSVQLPPLQSPTVQPRIAFRDQMPKYIAQAKSMDKSFAPTPKVSQSIDYAKFRGAAFQKYQLESEVRKSERKAVRNDQYFSKALDLHQKDRERDEIDMKIFMSEDFKSKIESMNSAINDAMQDFNQYSPDQQSQSGGIPAFPFSRGNEDERSPFVPSHVSKLRRAKQKQERELAEQDKIKAQWEKQQKKEMIEQEKEIEAMRRTNELLAHSLVDVQLESLENTLSVNDLAHVQEVATSLADSQDYSKISLQELDVDLSNFHLTQTQKTSTAERPSTKKANEKQSRKPEVNLTKKLETKKQKSSKEAHVDINLDERHIEAHKALESGDLAQYQRIQRDMKRFPKGQISSMMRKDPEKSDVAGAEQAQSPSKLAGGPPDNDDAFRKVIEDSMNDIEDQEVAKDINYYMESILNKRIEEKAENFEKSVLGNSLQVIKQTQMRIKKASLLQLNELIDEYISNEDKADISPLLQVYDQLAAKTKMSLPSKSMLQQDQKFFQEGLAKLRKAHKIELRWVRTESLKVAREYIEKKNHEISQAATKQIRDIYRQYHEVREQNIQFKKDKEALVVKLVGYEDRIAELANYVRKFRQNNIDEANQIKLIDTESIPCNPVEPKKKRGRTRSKEKTASPSNKNKRSPRVHTVTAPKLKSDESLLNYKFNRYQNFDGLMPSSQGSLTSQQTPGCECQLRTFQKMQNKFYERLSNFQQSYAEKVNFSSDGVQLPSANILTSVEEKLQALFNQQNVSPLQSQENCVSPMRIAVTSVMKIEEQPSAFTTNRNSLEDKDRSAKRGSSVDSQETEQRSARRKRRGMRAKLNMGDPLLQGQFSFYNSHFKVNTEDMIPVLKDQVVNYYQGRQIQLEEYVGVLESENRFFKERNGKLHCQVIVNKEKIKELNERIRHHLAHSQQEFLQSLNRERTKYKELEKESARVLKQCKQIFAMEVLVLEKVLERALQDNREKTNLLRQFAFVLKTPRLHHEYIERNGVDPFIEKFTKLISENQALKNEMERIGENRRVRNAVSMVKDKCRKDKQSMFTKSLPMQLELLIRQRAKFMGKALDEVKVEVKPFKPRREMSLQQRRRQEANNLSKSMSVAPSSFRVERDDPFDSTHTGVEKSVFSAKRVNLVVPKQQLRDETPQKEKEYDQQPLRLSPQYSQAELLSPSKFKKPGQLLNSQEFTLAHAPSHKQVMGDTSRANLKDFIEETIRKRTDFNSSMYNTGMKANANGTQRSSQSNFGQAKTGQNSSQKEDATEATQMQSKTILHQAYMQALSQSSSLQEIEKTTYLPGNVLARSDANLARTRQKFLNQYEMVNQYMQYEGMPSYKFALSSSLIDSVDTVIKNGSSSKDYVLQLKQAQSQAQPFVSLPEESKPKAVTTLDKNRIIERVNDQSEDGMFNTAAAAGVQQKQALSPSSSSKMLIQSYDDKRPFHKQLGMKGWDERAK